VEVLLIGTVADACLGNLASRFLCEHRLPIVLAVASRGPGLRHLVS
jgi:hypothetical protein